MTALSDLKPGVIVKVACRGHAQHGKYAIVDAVVAAWKLLGRDGTVFVMPPLVSVRIAEGDLTGEVFGLPVAWLHVIAVPPAWSVRLRRQAYGLDRPLAPGHSPIPAPITAPMPTKTAMP